MRNIWLLILIFMFLACGYGLRDVQGAIVISTLEQLQGIGIDADKPLNGNYELANNIDAASTFGWNGGEGWMPIGTSAAPFIGTFNGNGYVIENLHINRPASSDQGLFGYISSPSAAAPITVIENLGVMNALVKGQNQVGIIAGQSSSTLGRITIRNCSSSGTCESMNSGSYVGGIIGVTSRTIVEDCYSTASVRGFYNTGGLLGQSSASFSGASVVRCYAAGNVVGTFATGGLIGRINSGYVEDCYALGNVQGGTSWSDWAGGFCGFNNDSASTISRCYSAGDVANNGKSGAFIGNNLGTIANSFYCVDTITAEPLKTRPVHSGNLAGVLGVSAAQMRQIATFAAWDITLKNDHNVEVWWIKEGSTYPRLRYETKGINIALSSPGDLQTMSRSSVLFSAVLYSEDMTVTSVVLNLNGVEYETAGLQETGEYRWQRTVGSLIEGQYFWYLTVYTNDSGDETSTVSAVRSFEIDYSLPPVAVYYTPEPTPTMVIIDDDGAAGVYSDIRVTADSYGVPLSPAILLKYDSAHPETLPEIPEWGWGAMTLSQVLEMSNNGHSIISHGSMHTSHGVIESELPFVAGATTLDGGSTFNGRFSRLHSETNAQRGLTGVEVEIWETADEGKRETVYITGGGRYSVYDRNNPSSPNGWGISTITISSPLVNSYTSPRATMTVGETQRICEEVLAGFAAAGLPAPRHYVFPFNGVPPENQLNKLLEYFDTIHYEGTFTVYHAPLKEANSQPFLLRRKLIDGVTQQSAMDNILDQIITYQGLGFVYLHADYGGTPLFEYLISEAISRRVRILGFDEAWTQFRYKLSNIYPALDQEVENINATIELSLTIQEAKESGEILVDFFDVSVPSSPVLIETVLIGSGQTASASLDIEENKEYSWLAEISTIVGGVEMSKRTTEVFDFNTKRAYLVVFAGGDYGQITGGEYLQTVTYGDAAVAPLITPQSGWNFAGWDAAFDSVTNNLTVTAMYAQQDCVLSLSGDLDFGQSTVAGEKTLTFYISNNCYHPLVINAITVPEGFYGSWSGQIAAGGLQQVDVTFAPDAEGDYGGQIVVESDSTEGINTIACSGFVYFGGGTPQSPYKISNPLHLGGVNNDLAACYALTADIDLAAATYQSSVIAPYSDDLSPAFSGLFDGGGFVVRNLSIAAPTQSYLGLFGRIAVGGEVANLGVENAYIYGQDFVGTLAGRNDGIILKSFATGNTIAGNCIGGLVGQNNGAVRDCFARADVSGDWIVGGFVGRSSGSLINSYSTGRVQANNIVGGFSGINTNIDEGCLWDIQTSGYATGSGGAGKTTAQMQEISTYLSAGWDFTGESANGDMDLWYLLPGGCPRLYWQAAKGDINYDGELSLLDLRVLAAQWLTTPNETQRLAADINSDGAVDLLDYAEFCANWVMGR